MGVQASSTFIDRRGVWLFVLGCAAVTAGVLMHIPMFLMGRHMHFMLVGMPMGWDMVGGMALIIAGCLVAAWGLLPRDVSAQLAARENFEIAAPEDAHLGPAHWTLMFVLVVALVIDIMKPAALGFTVPGMIVEYGVPKATVSLVPFFALLGTVTGSVVWGVLADIYGRKATILLSAVMFVGTSICGAMPSLAWNIGMCFMMGAAAGGMLPVTYALLAEMMPSRHRGWSLVLVGGLGAVGGYFAASGASALLQPIFGWRILWLLNLPTGLLLVMLGVLIPESAKFLLARGRRAEAAAVMARFGATVRTVAPPRSALPQAAGVHAPLTGAKLIGKLVALSTAAIAWGLINFGLLLWLPADLVSKGYSVAVSSKLLAASALIAFPTVFLCAFIYSRWSTKWSLVTVIGITFLGLVGVMWLELVGGMSPVLPVALLIVGSNGIIAIVLPYTAESFPMRVRGRATGWVAACTKAGGVLAQLLSITALVPAMGWAAAAIMVPTLTALGLVAWFGRETRGADLRRLDEALDEPLIA
ncbi:putative MFS transporter [Sphingomonas naasensis]|uniref:MFS transporter n=1 Tax=Sphingomonas naasensis TaxID=1344951 RepID=A0A4S1WAP8_9SPHN|nr:MFS transporter [Sphingomonas naasensis]NIJ19883.1 putative MFS transporter [Sphingomonas naasensis]TGX39991.1 MFS transporter [Sphingomonas naasensis]